MFLSFGKKCCFCKESGPDRFGRPILRVYKGFAYDTIKHDYHEGCYLRVIGNAREQDNQSLDIAAEIDECRSFEKAERERRIKRVSQYRYD